MFENVQHDQNNVTRWRVLGWPSAVVVVAIVALAGLALSPGYSESMGSSSADSASMDYVDSIEMSSQLRFDISSIESRVQTVVLSTVILYESKGVDAFELITPDTRSSGIIFPFVLDAETLETVANGAFPNLDGIVPDVIDLADRPIGEILEDLDLNGVTWIEYMSTNPSTDTVDLKRSWLYLHEDGYIFGSGHYLPESRVYDVVDNAVSLYESLGKAAFDEITPATPIITAALYPFVLNGTDLSTVAHGTIPSFVGTCCSDAIQNRGDRPIEVILEDLQREGGTWVEYIFTNPDTQTEQLKRTWLFLHGDYIFGSGYYLQDSRAQSLVEEAIHLYTSQGTDAFDTITPDPETELHTFINSFVLDGDTLVVQAHNVLPHRVGSVDGHLSNADRSLYQIRSELDKEDGIWVAYLSENPNTRTTQLTRTYLVEHDGYIFGAGYYYPDSRLQSKVDESVYTYRSLGPEAFDIISSDFFTDGISQVVRNYTHVVARGSGPGAPQFTEPIPIENAFNIAAARSLQSNWLAAQQGDGASTASVFTFSSAVTRTEQFLQVYGAFYDGYVFSGTYIVADADAQSVVDYAIHIYESNKVNDAWIDIITPKDTVITDAVYPFVLNASDWSTVAHGTFPDLVGVCCSDAIRETSVKPFETVRAELDRDGTAWVEYNFLNPDTGTDQLKRTWLVEHDGYLFGAGYYISDSRVQAIVYKGTLDYDLRGEDAAFARFNTIPNEPKSLYLFVVDPATEKIVAQGVDSSLIGSTSEWEAALAAELNLMNKLETENGEFVTYTFVNPKTGEEENKRTWLTLHKGYIYGAGYYATDALEYAALLRSLDG